MCFDDNSYSASNHFIQDLKENDPKLDSLLARARNDDGDALFAGSLVLLGGFELAPITRARRRSSKTRAAATMRIRKKPEQHSDGRAFLPSGDNAGCCSTR